MRSPSVHTAQEIAGYPTSEEYAPGKWRPARPCPFYYGALSWEGWRKRFILAWRVFTGRCDVLSWGEKSGEWSNDQCQYRSITHPEFKRN